MKIVVCHSAHERCGIAEYGRQLDRAFTHVGLDVVARNFNNINEYEFSTGDVLFVHFEPSLVPAGFIARVGAAKQRGAKVVICCHWYDKSVFSALALRLVDRFVLHRGYGFENAKFVEIPLGCPVYDVTEGHTGLRERLGLPLNAHVLTTVGFLAPWKHMPDLVEAFLGEASADTFLQVLSPRPFSGDGAEDERRIRDMIVGAENRVLFSTEFRPERDLLDRIRASTLGLLYHSQHTGSVSAATKQFVSARTPLIATHSTHASDLREGIHRAGSASGGVGTAGDIVSEALSCLRDPAVLRRMRAGMEREYERINMIAVAGRYLNLFRSIT